MSYTILIIEDHPLIANSYKQAFQVVAERESIAFNIKLVHNIDDALNAINDESYMAACNLVFLDVQLPIGINSKILSGEDLGQLVRKKYPKTKISVITSLNDNYRLRSILKSVNPDALLIKNDLTPDELILAIKAIIKKPPYYTSTVLNLMRLELSEDIQLDQLDRQLLYELSIGTKMVELPAILLLSMAGIEKRKRNLKMLFEVEDQSDRELILSAKERGFI